MVFPLFFIRLENVLPDLEKILIEVEKAVAAASSLQELDGVRVAQQNFYPA